MKPINRTTLHTENSKRRGISPAVAAIILIVAAVVIGVLVVMYTMGLFKSTTTAPQMMVRNVVLYCTSTEPSKAEYEIYATFEILKGTAKLDSSTLKVCIGSSCYTGSSIKVEVVSSSTGATNVPLVLSSGQIATLSITILRKTGCTPSNAYLVSIYYQGQTVYRGQLVAQVAQS